MKKQCIVFIDDNGANNKLQTEELGKKLPSYGWRVLDDRSDNTPSRPTQFEGFNIENIHTYRHDGNQAELCVASLKVTLKKYGGNDTDSEYNKTLMGRVGEALMKLKNSESFHTMLPVVDLCLSENSTMLDEAWTITNVEEFFKTSLSGLKIKILTSAVANVLVSTNIDNLEGNGVLFVPRPIIRTQDILKFDEDASSVSTREVGFFMNLLDRNKIVANQMPEDFIKLFRDLNGTYKKYERYLYSIMVANEILLCLSQK